MSPKSSRHQWGLKAITTHAYNGFGSTNATQCKYQKWFTVAQLVCHRGWCPLRHLSTHRWSTKCASLLGHAEHRPQGEEWQLPPRKCQSYTLKDEQAVKLSALPAPWYFLWWNVLMKLVTRSSKHAHRPHFLKCPDRASPLARTWAFWVTSLSKFIFKLRETPAQLYEWALANMG